MESRVSALIEDVRNGVRDTCKDEYYYSEGYLLRWLKHEQMDANKAIKAFKAQLDWRAENNINTILEEDFSDFERILPIDCDLIDRHDRVVVKIFMHDFQLKNLKLDECRDKMIRYALWISERIEKLIKAQSKATLGNVNQAVVVIDCKGVTDALKGIGWTKLPLAVRILQEMLSQMNPNYPGSSQQSIIVNASKWFTKIFHLLKPFMSKETLAATQIHSSISKYDWKAELLDLETAST